jgi:gas vesicle protein
MRTSEVFILGTIMGAVTGAVVVGLWGRKIEDYVGETTRGVRAQTVAGMRAVEEKAGQVLDRSGNTLRRAEEFLQDTKEHVSEALRAGQDAIRPAPTTRKA